MKRIKMVLYAEPGVGKSVFASKAPKPFFICTDGNYEWLEEFGADPNAHFNASSWSDIKSLLNSSTFDEYETIVLDLTEDAFKWCESEYCVRNKIEHLSDLGYGKAYDATRNEFFIEICKLFSMDKHIILIMHGVTFTVKDRRGVEHTRYGPTGRIPEKVLDMIEGRVRYFLRAYVKDEEQSDGTVIKRRFLSLVPKPNEYGIIRGVNETKIAQDIPLEWSEFINAIGLTSKDVEQSESKIDFAKAAEKVKSKTSRSQIPASSANSSKPVEEKVEDKVEEKVEEKVESTVPCVETSTESTNVTPAVQTATEPPKQVSNEDKLAAIRAKLAAINKKKEV